MEKNWTREEDLLLAETVLRHIREGSGLADAFGEVESKLNCSASSCRLRWNLVVKHYYINAVELAKKQRKELNQRLLDKKQQLLKRLEAIKEGNIDEYLLIETIDDAIEYIEKH